MTLYERMRELSGICERISKKSQLTDKQRTIKRIPVALKDDFYFILELLNGNRPLGYKYYAPRADTYDDWERCKDMTFREYLELLWEPMKKNLINADYIRYICNQRVLMPNFVSSVLNRTMRLGITLGTANDIVLHPMEPIELTLSIYNALTSDTTYFVTEQVAGTRCIAMYLNNDWKFIISDEKLRHIKFDMTGLNTKYVYDGVISNVKQTQQSVLIDNVVNCDAMRTNWQINADSSYTIFRKTKTVVDEQEFNKEYIYNVFDIAYNAPFYERRMWLSSIRPASPNVRIVPLLSIYNKRDLGIGIMEQLNTVHKLGGTGIIINTGNRVYEYEKTDACLSVTDVSSMYMKVSDVVEGAGKYAGIVGAIVCDGKLDDGSSVTATVADGLTIEQRYRWAFNPSDIIGKVVEVNYFALNDNRQSLWFPRLNE